MNSQAPARVKPNRIADLFYWAVLAITAANYSFITFAQDSDELLSSPLKPLAYSRLPIAALGVLYMMSIRRRYRSDVGIMSAIWVLMFSLMMSVPFSSDLTTAATYAVWFFFQIFFLLMYVNHVFETVGFERAKFKLAMPLFLFGAYFLLLTLAALPNYVIGRPFPALYTTRVQVAMLLPLLFGGAACCFTYLGKSMVRKYLLYGFLFFGVLVILFSGKRASIVCMLLVAAGYFFVSMRWSGRIYAVCLVPVLLSILIFTSVGDTAVEASEFTVTRVEKGFDSDTATSINARFGIWSSIGQLAASKPLGIGLNVGRQEVGGGLHNTYLGFLLETGWLSIIAVIYLLLLAFYRGFFSAVDAKKEMLLYLVVPCALYSITEYNTSPGQPLFVPLWVSIFFCLLRDPRKKRRSKAVNTARVEYG